MQSSTARAISAALILAICSKLLRIFLENVESQVQTRMVRAFAERLTSAALGGARGLG
jgi:CRP-like cAMP-binding protein